MNAVLKVATARHPVTSAAAAHSLATLRPPSPQDAAVSRVDAACFAVAGPVNNEACNLTNVAWSIDAKQLRSQLGTSCVRCVLQLVSVPVVTRELRCRMWADARVLG